MVRFIKFLMSGSIESAEGPKTLERFERLFMEAKEASRSCDEPFSLSPTMIGIKTGSRILEFDMIISNICLWT
jgi:hypothetical protein